MSAAPARHQVVSTAPAAQRFSRTIAKMRGLTAGWNRLGNQTAFYVRALTLVWDAIARYKAETLRLIAGMSLGVGALAIIGGTVVVVTTLVMSTGSFVGIQLYRSLSDIGVEALSGFASAYINTRFAAPLTAAIGLAATIGAGATAQLGAMRINEEIDALEVMGIRAISYLVSTRIVAGVIVTVPLWCLSSLAGYLATRTLVVVAFGQAPGVYDHYFQTYLQPTDLIWSLLQVMVTATIVMLIHTYYGFNASGGPAGVGEAVGRSVRASLTVAVSVQLAVAMAAYGVSGNFNLSG
ncbi:ABC transporter permease [Mycobacterium sp. MUNTM1]